MHAVGSVVLLWEHGGGLCLMWLALTSCRADASCEFMFPPPDLPKRDVLAPISALTPAPLQPHSLDPCSPCDRRSATGY